MIKRLKKLLNCFANRRLKKSTIKSVGANSKLLLNKLYSKVGCELVIGTNSIIESSIYFDKEYAKLEIGDRTFIGASMIVCANRIYIGNDVLISWGCTLVDHNSHAIAFSKRSKDVLNWLKHTKNWADVVTLPININNKAWLGFNVTVLKGVTIGEGAVVGAGSVVTKDVAPYTIVAGNPAKIVREIPLDER